MTHVTNSAIQRLSELIVRVHGPLTFTIFEVGAVPLDGNAEPFHQLLDLFPGSKVIAFEIDAKLCEDLNMTARPGLTYYPLALGLTERTQPFYDTAHPMCGSLFKPNEALLNQYNGLEVAMLKSVSSVNTVSLDHFARSHDIGSVDFIKIDIQGAELDVFKGGAQILDTVLAIVSEVEFIPLYIDQPLFGDVCQFLATRNLMFHKFLGVAGRTIKPFIFDNNPNFAVQHMWADAVFTRQIGDIPQLSSQQLLRTGVLAFLYNSPDLAMHCFQWYDKKNHTALLQEVMADWARK